MIDDRVPVFAPPDHRTRGTPTPGPVTAEPRSRPLEGVTVLVVDDDAPSAKLVSVVLRAEGCVVREAGSAEEALGAVIDERPRLIVLDLVLPLMSGLLLVQQLKADPTTRDITVVAMTAFNGRMVEDLAIRAGCAAYLTKPIDPLSFAELVRASLT